jgi:hypothetical protein
MATYKTLKQAGLKSSPKQDAIQQELQKLYQQHNSVTPELVLDAAKAPTHPLHKYFEWDDSVAANKYRLDQAYQMILASKFVVEIQRQVGPVVVTDQHVVRNLVPAHNQKGFKMRNEVLSDVDSRAALIAQKKQELRTWCKGVVDIAELRDLREQILGLL